MTDTLMHTYGRLPVTFSHGEGAWLTDTDGKRYLDALSGIAVCGLGHSHPAITEAIADQAGKLLHTSNLYGIETQQQLGDTLTRLAGMDRVFFSNSGAEANEAAIKLARLYGNQREINNPAIIVTEGSFHGRTLATLSATGNRKVHAGFEPLVQGFVRVPFNDLEAIKAVAANRSDVVAVLVEPIQGEGGINIPDAGYLEGIREICDANNWLMMLDEIQTGMGRTGKMFAYQHTSIAPDVMTSAKGLGNGVPIGACMARGAAAELFAPGNHGSTFGGNPLVCRVAQTVCEITESENLAARATELSEKLLAGFQSELGELDGIAEIRAAGLMLAIELNQPCPELVKLALDDGLLINVTAGSVVRLLPPLTFSDAEAEQLISQLSSLIRAYLAESLSQS